MRKPHLAFLVGFGYNMIVRVTTTQNNCYDRPMVIYCVRRCGTTAGPLKSDTLTAENRHPFRWSDSWRNWHGDRRDVSPHAVCFIL